MPIWLTIWMICFMKTEDTDIYPVDYHSANLSKAFKTIVPKVYRSGDFYCCLSGTNHVTGILGRGKTKDEAVKNWKKHLQKRNEDLLK